MKKHFLSLLLAMIMLLPCASSAASFETGQEDNSTVVTGNVDIGTEEEAVSVLIRIYDEDENLNFFDIFYTDETGKVTFSYLNKGKSGTYTAYAEFEGEYENMDTTFEFRSKGFWDNLTTEFLSIKTRYASAENKAPLVLEMEEFVNEYQDDLELDLTIYNGLSDKTKVCEMLCTDAELITEISDIKKSFYRSTGLEKWNEDNNKATSAMLMGTELYAEALYAEKLPMSDEECVLFSLDKKYQSLIWAKAAANDYIDAKKLIEDLTLYTLTVTIENAESYHVVRDVIEAYYEADIIDVNVEKNDRTDNPTSVYKAIMNKKMDSYADVEDYYNNYKSKTSKDEGSSGGSGGSGFTAIGGATNPQITTPAVQPRVTEFFTDLNEYMWAYEAVYELKNRGFLNGVSATEFGPGRNITRAEVAAILVRILGYDTNAQISGFYDVATDNWYYPYVAAAYKHGIFTGKGNGCFGACDVISREEIAVIAARVLKALEKEAPTTTFVYEDHNEIDNWAVEGVYDVYAASIMSGKSNVNFAPKDSLIRAEAAVLLFRLVKYAGI